MDNNRNVLTCLCSEIIEPKWIIPNRNVLTSPWSKYFYLHKYAIAFLYVIQDGV